MTTVTAQALQKLWWKSWEWTPKEKSLEWMVHIDTRVTVGWFIMFGFS